MDVTKPYEFIGFGAIDVTKPYEFIGFGATRSTLKIEDPFRGPGKVDSRARTKDLASMGPQNLRSRGTLPPKKNF